MKSAVVLMNLGTPSAPTVAAIRRYLREFLSDKRVVEIPRYIWYPILYGIILPFRPKRTAVAYQQLWNEYGDSPLRVIRTPASFGGEGQSAATAFGDDLRRAVIAKYD